MRPILAPAVCLLGGESSGKSSLSQALQQRLTQAHGLRVACVPEHLRTWCESRQRAPLAHEQAAIAHQQTRLIRQAQLTPGVQLVIADTSALSIAVYSALYFSDASLLMPALISQHDFTATLLMGLDVPWQTDGLFRDSPAMRAKADSLSRDQLDAQRIPYQTVYGTGDRRLNNALRALGPILSPILGQAPVATDTRQIQGRPGWVCEACSDPDCEQRLFTRLLKKPKPDSGPP